MTEKLTDRSVRAFGEELAAKVSVPGGGGAAAIVGAYAAALCSMAGNFTVGKKKYAQYEDDLHRMLEEAGDIQKKLMDLVQEDADAFEPLSKAYSIPKDDPDRAEVLEKATRCAAEPPLKMMREICRSIALLEEMLVKGSVIMVSDVGCGALLAGAALESAALNVFVNTKSLRDREAAREIDAQADAMLSEYGPKAQEVASKVMGKLRKQ